MTSRFQLALLVLVLSGIGLGIAAYKHFQLGVPLRVGSQPSQWLIEAKVTFFATGEPVTARLALPEVAIDRRIGLDARSAGYRFDVENDLGEHAALWAADAPSGSQALYYQLRLPPRAPSSGGPRTLEGEVPQAEDPGLVGTLEGAARSVVRRAREVSSNPDLLFVALFREIAAAQGSQEMALLKTHYEDIWQGRAAAQLGIDLLNLAGVPARLAYAVELEELIGAREPVLMVEYHDGVYWKVRSPEEPASTLDPRRWFVWNRGGDALLEVSGGENSQVRFTAVQDVIPVDQLTELRESGFLVATIFGLPASERQVFRYVTLIPIGAFVVVLLRNLIGIATLGTFMPVLLALALLEMDLQAGLTMFVTLVAAGLAFRFLLSRLNLLVVPRVAACVVIVTLLMMLLSVLSWHLGLRDGLKITLFPMIILAWTIERMSLIWEEEGKRHALMQVGGSLLVAVVAYLVMEQKQIRYWAFYFPELLLVLLGGIILLGRYTGYRLSEWFRFKHFEEAA